MSHEATGLSLRWAVRILLVAAMAAGTWWARTGADEYTSSPEDGYARMAAASENVTASERYVKGFRQRERMLAPEFRSMRVVHELLIAGEVLEGPHGWISSGCCYIDPAQLADPTIGAGALPAVFAESDRAGYRFEFIGRSPSTVGYARSVTPYMSFVYIAWPESEGVAPYVFALHSDDHQVHYTTEWRVPSLLDPAVTEGVTPDGSESPAVTRLGLTIGESPWWARVWRRFFTSGNNVARAEERAIDDLRRFAAAQNALFLMLGARGYASVEALTNPGILEGVPHMPALVDEDFTQVERDGYRYTFTGDRLTQGGEPRLYQDYNYVALPVGDGPTGRRSFAIYPDGVVRVRTDGTAPTMSDAPVSR